MVRRGRQVIIKKNQVTIFERSRTGQLNATELQEALMNNDHTNFGRDKNQSISRNQLKSPKQKRSR